MYHQFIIRRAIPELGLEPGDAVVYHPDDAGCRVTVTRALALDEAEVLAIFADGDMDAVTPPPAAWISLRLAIGDDATPRDVPRVPPLGPPPLRLLP